MANKSKTQMVVSDNGVAIITINNPPLNLLSSSVLYSLKGSIEEALQRDEVKAIVITGSAGKFCGGADVAVFGNPQMVKKDNEIAFMSIEVITDLLEGARKPLVAAIDGFAFGGGLEIALACHARISTPTSQLGLTELQYGIIPGFGGSQRLPRLVGLPKALEMILMSKRINGMEAFRVALVDVLSPADELIRTASNWALDILDCRKPWIISLYKTDKLQPLKEARLILNTARARVKKHNPNLVHPLICIDVIEEGIVSGPRNGLLKEAHALNELQESVTCKSLVHIFFARFNTSKIPGITDTGLQPRKINKVGVIGGGGIFGSEIATAFILGNIKVLLKEDHQNLLMTSIGKIKANLQQTHLLTKQKLEKAAASLLKGVVDYDSFKDVDLVVETSEGSVELKQKIFADLERYCPQHCIFATNSSTIDIQQLIVERTKSKSRIVGTHFYSPSPLLEIVRTDSNPPQVIVDVLNLAKKMKKTPILVKGHAVNRMSDVYFRAASFVAQQFEEKYQIEQVMQKFGIGIRLFRTMDHIQLVDTMHKNREQSLSEEEILHIIMFPVVNEACRILEQKIVVKASDIDVVSVLAMGFPSYRGGIIYWANNTIGYKYIHSRLETWASKYGEFFKPCAYLKEQSLLGTTKNTQIKSQM
ncbi:glyoxysomal fatty acid beta-oxidation multifunctional protein MFP-a-like [Rutidosis leptorrhynchoides]|uniref:glyoxysomal fatty acid beta-oxidation multifunctional protein MFP-a-like n=1 Tax=Rutidosis leptorrhynchoides TaxID=125765 RepID=UPI003A99E4D0